MYFTGYNCEKTKRIMNQSQLVINRYADQDDKWNREDYRRSRTILKAKKEYLSQPRMTGRIIFLHGKQQMEVTTTPSRIILQVARIFNNH